MGNGNSVDTIEDRIQYAILTAIDSIIDPEVELGNSSMNACSGQDATSVTANSECEEHKGITATFEEVSEGNDSIHVCSTIDETQHYISVNLGKLSVPGTIFHRLPHRFFVLLFSCDIFFVTLPSIFFGNLSNIVLLCSMNILN